MTDSPSSDLISARFDGELAGVELRQCDELLAGSPTARRELREFGQLSQQLRELPLTPVPADVTQAILQVVQRAPVTPSRAPRGARPAALLAAAMCLGLVGTLIYFGPLAKPEAPGIRDDRLARHQAAEPADATVTAPAVPAPLAEPEMRAENPPWADDSPLELSEQVRKLLDDPVDFRELKAGDKLPTLHTQENRVLVVYLTVVDVERSLDDLQLLIGVRQPADAVTTPPMPGEPKAPGELPAPLRGLYVEANSGKSKFLLDKITKTDSIQKILVSETVLKPESTSPPAASAKASSATNLTSGVYFQQELTLTRPDSLGEIARRLRTQRDSNPKSISPEPSPAPHRLLFILEQKP